MNIMKSLSSIQLNYIKNHVVNAIKVVKNPFTKNTVGVLLKDGNWLIVKCNAKDDTFYAQINNHSHKYNAVGFKSNSILGALKKVTMTVE